MMNKEHTEERFFTGKAFEDEICYSFVLPYHRLIYPSL